MFELTEIEWYALKGIIAMVLIAAISGLIIWKCFEE